MSKYDQYIREYLLKNSELSVEKIGDFAIMPGAVVEKSIQPQFISFNFNKRAQTSEGLIAYISGQTAKNKVLITSDLSSVFDEARQYINIGKVFNFAGLGNLSLNRSGEYEFSASSTTPVSTESTYTGPQEKESPGSGQAGRNAVVAIAILIVLLVLGGVGWGIYKFFNRPATETPATAAPAAADSAKAAQNPADSIHPNSAPVSQIADSSNYKFVFETTHNSNRAYKRYDSLLAWKEKCLLDSMPQDSGMVYDLYVVIKAAAKDTSYIKDSLQKYYDRPTPIIIRHN